MELDVREWLKISFAFGLTNIKRWDYIDIDHPFESLNVLLSDPALQDDLYLRSYRSVSSEQIDSIMELCDDNDIDIITPDDHEYPDRLRYLKNPPAVLYAMGDVTPFSECACTAIVGARQTTDYTNYITKRISAELASQGIAVISGAANGADSLAHIGAIEAGGLTAAFLGCGILFDFPKNSMALKRLIAENGAVLSEYPPTARPTKDSFKIRNRLIAALSDCVIITQSAIKSGTLNTASHAAEQGKELFVVPPHDIYDPRYFGQAALIRDGARPFFSVSDIIEYFGGLYPPL